MSNLPVGATSGAGAVGSISSSRAQAVPTHKLVNVMKAAPSRFARLIVICSPLLIGHQSAPMAVEATTPKPNQVTANLAPFVLLAGTIGWITTKGRFDRCQIATVMARSGKEIQQFSWRCRRSVQARGSI